MSHVCGAMTIILLGRDLSNDGEKNKEFLFLIIKKRMKSLFSILVTKNLNRFQNLDKGTDYVEGGRIMPSTPYLR